MTKKKEFSFDTPITGKELRKYGKIVMVCREDDPEEINEVEINEPLGVVDGIHIRSKYEGGLITVEPIIEVNDQHIAVARLKFRRVTKVPGDEWG